jgi:hypothetical protein
MTGPHADAVRASIKACDPPPTPALEDRPATTLEETSTSSSSTMAPASHQRPRSSFTPRWRSSSPRASRRCTADRSAGTAPPGARNGGVNPKPSRASKRSGAPGNSCAWSPPAGMSVWCRDHVDPPHGRPAQRRRPMQRVRPRDVRPATAARHPRPTWPVRGLAPIASQRKNTRNPCIRNAFGARSARDGAAHGGALAG